MNNCERYSHVNRTSRAIPYPTQRPRAMSGGGSSPPTNAPIPPPPIPPVATQPTSGFLSLEPASPSVFASYPTGWQSTSYWAPTNPGSPAR